MKDDNDFTAVIIKCPECESVQDAIIEHTIPFYTYIHQCERCNYIIMESEFNQINKKK